MNSLLSERLKIVLGLAPVADAFAGTVTSDVVALKKYGRALFGVLKGVGATGTSTLTVQASAASDGSSPAAIPFKYRRVASGDTAGDVTQATASGFVTTAGSTEMYLIEVAAEDCPSGKPWVHVKAVESVDSPVVGAIVGILGDPRYGGDDLPTAIA